MKFSRLRKKLSEYGIEWDSTIGKGSHGAFVGLTHKTRIRQVHVLPRKQQKEISSSYLNPLRRAFELTPEYGVSDKEFLS